MTSESLLSAASQPARFVCLHALCLKTLACPRSEQLTRLAKSYKQRPGTPRPAGGVRRLAVSHSFPDIPSTLQADLAIPSLKYHEGESQMPVEPSSDAPGGVDYENEL